ncbi:MAG: Hsp20/alpha crystallin family protein [Burkholderiales bacterium]|nr:Hsp20/alpha crystallin family protein [Burkholderiales bacterium]
MANITRFDPFGELSRFDPFRDFESMFRLPRAAWRNLPEVPDIKMDVSEDEKSYRVKAEVPGVKKENIKVAIDGNQVSINADVKQEKEEKKGETVIRSERYYGNQYRAFTLPQEVDASRAEAKYEDGLLELVLPKKEGSSVKQVTIK